MAMDLSAKAAYIRGLMTGMEFDPEQMAQMKDFASIKAMIER